MDYTRMFVEILHKEKKLNTFELNITIKKRINVLGKNGSTEHSKGSKTVPEKVATTCTEDGHKQTTKTSTTM